MTADFYAADLGLDRPESFRPVGDAEELGVLDPQCGEAESCRGSREQGAGRSGLAGSHHELNQPALIVCDLDQVLDRLSNVTAGRDGVQTSTQAVRQEIAQCCEIGERAYKPLDDLGAVAPAEWKRRIASNRRRGLLYIALGRPLQVQGGEVHA